jgi:hypothetical protein
MDWLIVLIFVIVVILVWLFLLINAKEDVPDIKVDIHPEALAYEPIIAEKAHSEEHVT